MLAVVQQLGQQRQHCQLLAAGCHKPGRQCSQVVGEVACSASAKRLVTGQQHKGFFVRLALFWVLRHGPLPWPLPVYMAVAGAAPAPECLLGFSFWVGWGALLAVLLGDV
jgi:hypothetical protein